MNIDAHTAIEIASAICSIYVTYINMRLRADIADLKIWIYENFETKK